MSALKGNEMGWADTAYVQRLAGTSKVRDTHRMKSEMSSSPLVFSYLLDHPSSPHPTPFFSFLEEKKKPKKLLSARFRSMLSSSISASTLVFQSHCHNNPIQPPLGQHHQLLTCFESSITFFWGSPLLCNLLMNSGKFHQ